MNGCTAGVNGQCGLEVYAKSMCKAHYAAKLQGRSTDREIKRYAKHNQQKVCGVPECEEAFYASGKCQKHYQRDYRIEKREKEKI